jgi:hypothetical protein
VKGEVFDVCRADDGEITAIKRANFSQIQAFSNSDDTAIYEVEFDVTVFFHYSTDPLNINFGNRFKQDFWVCQSMQECYRRMGIDIPVQQESDFRKAGIRYDKFSAISHSKLNGD